MRETALPVSDSRSALMTGMPLSDRRLEVQQRPLLLGDRRKLDAVIGKQRLVGCHHMETTLECGAYRDVGSTFGAAHQLDEDVDIALFGKLFRPVEPGNSGKIDAAVPCPVSRGDRRDDDRTPAGDGKLVAFLLNDADKRGANGAQARNADFEGICHGSILKCLCGGSRLTRLPNGWISGVRSAK